MADIPGEESGPVGAAGQGEGGQSGRNGGDGEGHRPDEDEHGHDDDRVRWHVHGTVTEGTGAPVDGAEVRLFWQQIRSRNELARGRTSEAGRYHLHYDMAEEAPQPVLVVVEVRAGDVAPVDSALTTAGPEVQIDVVLQPADTSEWGELTAKAARFLGSLTLTEVVEDSEHSDISFLARELNVSTEAIMRLAVSARLEASFQLPAASFYAFLRQQVPAALPRPLLEASDGFTLIDALVASIASMIFGLDAATQRRQFSRGRGRLRLYQPGGRCRHAFERAPDAPSERHVDPSLPRGQRNARSAPRRRRSPPGAATGLCSGTGHQYTDDPRLLADPRRRVARSDHSAGVRSRANADDRLLRQNYVPLVQELVGQFNAGTYTQLHDLARISLQDWETTIGRTGAPPGVQPAGNATPEQVFAAVVYARIPRVYPTAALLSRVATSGVVPAEDVQPVQQFFTNNPDLELVKHYLAGYLQQKGDAAFTGVAEDAQPAVLDIVRRMQRVLKVAPEVDVAEALLQNGISSATDIAMLGEVQFLPRPTRRGSPARRRRRS